MEIRKGVIYRGLDDLIKMLYKTEQARFIEENMNSKWYNESLFINKNFVWEFRTNKVPFFLDDLTLRAVPHFIAEDSVKLLYLLQMRDHPLLNIAGRSDEFQDDITRQIIDIRDHHDTMEDVYKMGSSELSEEPSYIFIYDNRENLIGVFSCVPRELFEDALSDKVIYDCSVCDNYESATDHHVPEFYYNEKNNKLYCADCAKKVKKETIHHIGK